MNIKKHIKKKDWVFYLVEFLVFVLVFFLVSWLFGDALRKSAISAVVSGIIFTVLSVFVNHMGEEVEKDKR
jgi:membrane associated rhomboid family serine protease